MSLIWTAISFKIEINRGKTHGLQLQYVLLGVGIQVHLNKLEYCGKVNSFQKSNLKSDS